PYSYDEVDGELRSARDLLFLFHEGEPVGFAWLRERREEGEIEPMGIIPGEQGQGAGRALLSLALQRLRQRGQRRVRIGAWRQNKAAIHLYENAGLRRVGRRYYLVYKLVA
ncbi:MAG: GNAT family N-acetyltransferase, partial [Chloroflexota bacterium]